MADRASYSCTFLMGTNKSGDLRPDADGYYTVVFGAFNIYNSSGAYYPLGPAKELFAESGSLMRRLNGGNLRSEYGHPKMEPGMSVRDFMGRLLEIREENVCCHIRKVTLVEDFKDKNGRSCVAVIAEIKPSGPQGAILKAQLDNKHENVCFSIRSFTTDTIECGTRIKSVSNIITWDYVNEPGIAIAQKYLSPALEAPEFSITLEEVSFTLAQLRSVAAKHEHLRSVGMESHFAISIDELEESLGWSKAKQRPLPPSAEW